MYVQWLFIVGLTAVVNARDCSTSEAMENFEMSKYEGVWYNLAMKIANETGATSSEEYKCVSLNFKTVDAYVDCEVNYLSKGIPKKTFGKFTLVNSTKGLFTINLTQFPAFKIPYHKVLCTDYDTYAVVHSTAPHEAGHCLEYATLNGRDRAKFEELATNDDVKKCIQDKLQTSLEQFTRLPMDECH